MSPIQSSFVSSFLPDFFLKPDLPLPRGNPWPLLVRPKVEKTARKCLSPPSNKKPVPKSCTCRIPDAPPGVASGGPNRNTDPTTDLCSFEGYSSEATFQNRSTPEKLGIQTETKQFFSFASFLRIKSSKMK